jgi:predicted mannosyl-3-phosphoglycerate phosphatase (HAD superfamily)
LVTAQSVEFEYAVTNGEIDFDKIVAQRKRTRFASVNCREVEGFGRYKAAEHQSREYAGRIFACDSPDSESLWYLVTRLKDKGLTLIVFNANDKMLNGIKPFLPRPIMHEAFKFGE